MFVPIIADDADWLISIKVGGVPDEGGVSVVGGVLEVGGVSVACGWSGKKGMTLSC